MLNITGPETHYMRPVQTQIQVLYSVGLVSLFLSAPGPEDALCIIYRHSHILKSWRTEKRF